MKNVKNWSIIALFLLPFIACRQEAEPILNESGMMEFYATLSDEPQSKTVRQADGKVFWSPNEEIQIFQGGRKGKFTSLNTDDSAIATFSGKMDSNIDDGSDYWAVYPYDSGSLFDSWYVTIPIQPNQTAKAGSFADGMFPLIAKSSSNQLSFMNICGGIKFRVYNTGIKHVIFRGNNDETVAGAADVSFTNGLPIIQGIYSSTTVQASKGIQVTAPDANGFIPGEDYYIVIPPIKFTHGFTLTFCNSENLEASFSTDKSITVTRSKFGVLNELDKGLVFGEGDEAKKAREKDALIAIYNKLNGGNWTNHTNWLTDSPVGTWNGVITDDDGFVSSLWLSDPNLQGQFPSEICVLDNLQVLTLVGSVSGPIPTAINTLSKLTRFDFSSGVFSGSIPNEVCDLSELEILRITGVSGALPERIGELTKLKELAVSGISGPLPESLGNLSNLETLVIFDAPLNQSFPSAIVEFSHLQSLSLNNCGLTGTIPDRIGDLSELLSLSASNNDLTGKVPDSIGSLKKLKSLSLGGNAFTGFPETLSQCTNLESVSITDNSATMVIDNDIWDAPALTEVYLSNSHITGSLANNIGNATNLSVINLMDNEFSGELPSTISNLTSLHRLYLNRNQFSGELPASMSNLQALEELDIHNNAFTGSIPDSFKLLTGLTTFYAYNNYMSGQISEEVIMLDVFSNWQLLPQYNDGKFTYSLYESINYSQDKQITLLHCATKGNGINIVFMGDGFTDKDIDNGDYDYAMNLACEALFEVEPFTSYEEYFNVYSVTLVSKNGHYIGETALNVNYEPILGSNGYSWDSANIKNMLEVLFPEFNLEQTTVGIIVNHTPDGGACCDMAIDTHFSTPSEPTDTPYGSGFAIGIIPTSYVKGQDGINSFKGTVLHEVVGHGFGKLGDEYAMYDQYADTGTLNQIDTYHRFGYYMNLSTSSDVADTPWKDFLAIPGYTSTGTGIYEGAWYSLYGIWRPTEYSIMSCNYEDPYFNAPSREAIYKRINLIVNGPTWTYDFDEFLTWDARNLGSH